MINDNFGYRRKESKLLIEVKSSLCKLNLMGFHIKSKINNENERPSVVVRERVS